MEEKPATIRPLTYHEQYCYYIALCESASQIASNWKDYRRMIAQIKKELRADPGYKKVVANRFRAPEQRPVPESRPEEDSDIESLEAALEFEF